MKCKLLHDTPAAPTIPPNTDVLPKGTILDHPNAYIHVHIGAAESVDDECRERVDRTPKQLASAQYEHVRTRKGIHPDDFVRYAAGEMDGYNADGTEIPGPYPVTEDEDESVLILPENYDDEEEEDDE